MKQEYHSNAVTNIHIRNDINGSQLKNSEIAEKFNISQATVSKWKKREKFEDKISKPHNICWNTTGNPTLSDNFTTETVVNNTFISSISNLVEDTQYYARSYATNSAGTQYGNQISFSTLPSSIFNVDNDEIMIYPNPVSDKLYVYYKNKDILSIKITDITGRIIKGNNITSGISVFEIDLSNLTSGVYFIEIDTENSKIISKFVVK